MEKYMNASRGVVAARPRPWATRVTAAALVQGFGGELCPLTGRVAVRTDVFIPAPGSDPGGHPA